MKKSISILLLGALVMFSACEQDESMEQTLVGSKTVRFACTGDFGSPTFTRALSASGQDMTDLWVLDYVGGELVQTVHQDDNTAEDFGQPSVTLDYGTHTLCFVASLGTDPMLDTDSHTIIWGTVKDTFWKKITLTVSEASAGSQSVTLDRAVTKLTVTISDELPEGLATIDVIPTKWYYGIDYLTGEPAGQQESVARSITIPSSAIGKANRSINNFGFSSAVEWTTSVRIVGKDSEGSTMGQANITDAPFKANRVTKYTGKLFTGGSAFSLSLNATWDEEYNGSW